MVSSLSEQFEDHLRQQFAAIYPDQNPDELIQSVKEIFSSFHKADVSPLWSQKDSLLITYGDTLTRSGEVPLQTLHSFLEREVGETISMIHVLPFCPFSSDDGFSIIDYTAINPKLGTWKDLTEIAQQYRLMGDLVINHISAESEWFQNYLKDEDPGLGYFIEADPTLDYSEVVRPRASNLLSEVETSSGTKYVWCTFSHDQVDLNFENPAVLLQMLKVIRLYLEQGVQLLRLDAIGYLWKRLGTSCIHLPETHAVVRLIRTVLDHYASGSILITETNVPNKENLTYFGNCNEAHMIYNFSLAPLLIHALLTGRSTHLKSWMMSMPPAPPNCTFLNFTASHDGIGMRPAEGLLSEEEQVQMVQTIEAHGGKVSRRRMADGSERVYELNISLFDAFQGTVHGPDEYQIERFLCSQTITMGLEGLPAFYIHSLLATPNDQAGVESTGANRSINRHQWDMNELEKKLADPSSDQSQVSQELLRRIKIRTEQPAFHPLATQFTLQLKSHLFGFWRQSQDRQQSIFAIHNLYRKKRKIQMQDLNLIADVDWIDLISGNKLQDTHGELVLKPYQCVWISNRDGGNE